jgi:hypothetical protein
MLSTALAALSFLSQPHLLLACIPCIAVALADHDFNDEEEGSQGMLAGGALAGGVGAGTVPGTSLPTQKSVARLVNVDSEQGQWGGCCSFVATFLRSQCRVMPSAPLLINRLTPHPLSRG